jgi:hypothetical protein
MGLEQVGTRYCRAVRVADEMTCHRALMAIPFFLRFGLAGRRMRPTPRGVGLVGCADDNGPRQWAAIC